jgi:hypothetical protein
MESNQMFPFLFEEPTAENNILTLKNISIEVLTLKMEYRLIITIDLQIIKADNESKH